MTTHMTEVQTSYHESVINMIVKLLSALSAKTTEDRMDFLRRTRVLVSAEIMQMEHDAKIGQPAETDDLNPPPAPRVSPPPVPARTYPNPVPTPRTIDPRRSGFHRRPQTRPHTRSAAVRRLPQTGDIWVTVDGKRSATVKWCGSVGDDPLVWVCYEWLDGVGSNRNPSAGVATRTLSEFYGTFPRYHDPSPSLDPSFRRDPYEPTAYYQPQSEGQTSDQRVTNIARFGSIRNVWNGPDGHR